MRLLVICCLMIVSQLCYAQSRDNGLVEFRSTKKHLGMVERGAKVSDKFVFVNTSKEDVEIDLVSSCDCTQLKWTRGLIAPGKQGTISFIFDSNKKEVEEAVDIDVSFKNKDPKTQNPIVVFLSYTFNYPKG